MAGVTFAARVIGLREAKKAIADLPGAYARTMSERIEETAGNIAQEAGRTAPRGTSGDLARSYTYEMRPDKLGARVGTNTYYATFTELGTRRQRAQPHLFPAFQRGVRELRRNLRTLTEDTGTRLRVRRSRIRPVQ
jgi:HK97 gp10 family phage protein